jgi:transposase
MDISGLHKEGHSIKEIVRRTGYSRNTVRRAIRGEYVKKKDRKNRSTIIEPYKAYLQKRYEETGLTGRRLYEEIIKLGYEGCYDQVHRFLRKFKDEDIRSNKLTVRFETLPGKQAQVDWGECGYYLDEDGRRRKLYAFVMILGYSRVTYVELTNTMKLPMLLECHLNAFDYFGGVPDEILYDNMKQVRLGPGCLNPAMVDFASYYGFAIKTCRPYRARTKGKVERAIQFLKKSFFPRPVFESLAEANSEVLGWLNSKANTRIHSVTKEAPFELLKQENLRDLNSIKRYEVIDGKECAANFEGYVNYRGSRYSVPPEHAGKRVIVEHAGSVIRIMTTSNTIIFEHPRAAQKGMTVSAREHIAEMWKLTMSLRKSELQIAASENTENSFTSSFKVEQRPLSRYEEAV